MSVLIAMTESTKDIIVSPIKSIKFDLGNKSIAFCICTMDTEYDKYRSEFVHVLHFMDFTDGTRENSFQQYHAEQVHGFYISVSHNAQIECICVCCDSGESRSAAIAAALLRAQKMSDLCIWKSPEYHPNPYVYRLTCKSFGLYVDNKDLKKKLALNQEALHRLIHTVSQNN